MGSLSLSGIDLRLVRVFLRVVEHEGVSAAAAAEGVGLSSISRDISALETRLGVRLCRRGRSGFSLTDEGQEVLAATRSLMEEINAFESRVGSVRTRLPSAFHLGVIDHVLPYVEFGLTNGLQRLHAAMPDLVMELTVHPDSMIDILVREGKLDLGLTGQPQFLAPLEYRSAFVERHRLYISGRSDHAERILDALLSGDPDLEIPYVARSYAADAMDGIADQFKLRTVVLCNSVEAVLGGVLAGLGCGVLPVHFHRTYPDLLEIPVSSLDLEVPFSFVSRRDRSRSAVLQAFLRNFSSLPNN